MIITYDIDASEKFESNGVEGLESVFQKHAKYH